MPSRKPIDPLDHFETDVPISAEESEPQWRIRETRGMTTADYLAWCSWITRDAIAPCRDFHIEPFEL